MVEWSIRAVVLVSLVTWLNNSAFSSLLPPLCPVNCLWLSSRWSVHQVVCGGLQKISSTASSVRPCLRPAVVVASLACLLLQPASCTAGHPCLRLWLCIKMSCYVEGDYSRVGNGREPSVSCFGRHGRKQTTSWLTKWAFYKKESYNALSIICGFSWKCKRHTGVVMDSKILALFTSSSCTWATGKTGKPSYVDTQVTTWNLKSLQEKTNRGTLNAHQNKMDLSP